MKCRPVVLGIGMAVSVGTWSASGAQSAPSDTLGMVAGAVADSLGAVPDTVAPPVSPPKPIPADPPSEAAPVPLVVPGRTARDTTLSPREQARRQFALGLGLERKRLNAAAIEAYKKALRYDPTYPEANYRAGMLFLTRAQVSEAAKRFEAEMRSHPGNADAARELGLALARLDQGTRAIAVLERLTHRQPDDDEAWRALAFAYKHAGRLKDAESALHRSIALKPPRSGEHRDLALLLGSTGRIEEARAQYRRASVLDPKDATVWYNFGNLERRVGRLEQALAHFRGAEARDSGFSLATQGQIDVLLRLERPAEAGETYRRWLRVRPDDHNARLEAVRLYDKIGRQDIATELAREGVRRSPRAGDSHLILGMVLGAHGDMSGALVEMRKAEALFGDGEEREKVRQMIALLRAGAKDSLRALFVADSTEHSRP